MKRSPHARHWEHRGRQADEALVLVETQFCWETWTISNTYWVLMKVSFHTLAEHDYKRWKKQSTNKQKNLRRHGS